MTRSAVKMAAGTRDYTCKSTRINGIFIVLIRFVYRWWLLCRANERLPVRQQRCGDDTRPRDIRESSIKITEDSIIYRLNIPNSRAVNTSYKFFLFWTPIAELVINSISVLARTCPRLAGEDRPHRREYCWRHNHGQYVWKICTVRYSFVSSKFYFCFLTLKTCPWHEESAKRIQ